MSGPRGNHLVLLVPARTPAAPKAQRGPGKMRVILNVHGGQQGLASVAQGLVARNERAVRTGTAGPFDPDIPLDEGAAAWRDAPLVQRDGYMSGKSAAAWLAATLRAQGRDARVGFRAGQPAVFEAQGSSWAPVKVFPGPGVGYLGPTEGRTDERMVLVIDDDQAMPVREVNQAIAHHNARRIREKGLPPLYKSGVKYKTEGSPELWWDAEEILSHGHDDCEGLAAYRAGELINHGYDARVYTRLVKHPDPKMGGSSGGRLFHAVTKIYSGPGGTPISGSVDGTAFDDPSKRLGMPVPDWYLQFAQGMRARGQNL